MLKEEEKDFKTKIFNERYKIILSNLNINISSNITGGPIRTLDLAFELNT